MYNENESNFSCLMVVFILPDSPGLMVKLHVCVCVCARAPSAPLSASQRCRQSISADSATAVYARLHGCCCCCCCCLSKIRFDVSQSFALRFFTQLYVLVLRKIHYYYWGQVEPKNRDFSCFYCIGKRSTSFPAKLKWQRTNIRATRR